MITNTPIVEQIFPLYTVKKKKKKVSLTNKVINTIKTAGLLRLLTVHKIFIVLATRWQTPMTDDECWFHFMWIHPRIYNL